MAHQYNPHPPKTVGRQVRIWIANRLWELAGWVRPFWDPYDPDEDDEQWWRWDFTFHATNTHDADQVTNEITDVVAEILGDREWVAGGGFIRDHLEEDDVLE